MKYYVEYGVNNSHLTEGEFFKLYRDAVKFYREIDAETFKSAIIWKMEYNKDGFVCSKEAKMYRSVPGSDNTKFLNSILSNSGVRI